MNTYKLLKKLTETPGPSGSEKRIVNLVSELWEPYVDTISTDSLGSVFATKRGSGEGPRCKLLLASHIDEIGLMVTKVIDYEGHGFLHIINVGGVDIRPLYAQEVTVHGREDLFGVLSALPSRMLPEDRRSNAYGFEDLVVDTGLPAESVQELVEVGDFITFHQPMRKLMGKNVTGKAVDNRASVAAVTICLEQLNGRQHDWDVVAVGTVQEETRLLGAFTGAFSQQPDAAIALDVTFARGAGLTEKSVPELGSGPVLDIGPNIHPGIHQALKDAADALEIEVSPSIHTRGSGTDAFGLQVARSGVPTGLISMPIRNMHTMVETISTKDVERAGRLLAEFIARLDGEFLDGIARTMMENE